MGTLCWACYRTYRKKLLFFFGNFVYNLYYNIYNLKYQEGSSRIDIPSYQQIKKSNELKFLMHPLDAASYLVEYYWPITLEV